ncbi:MAG: hypothetical protein LBD11_02890 [Candidatus Peribacteria bacterium]|nr:hypothetical protein [Candidatus Peribacteria bacterium]
MVLAKVFLFDIRYGLDNAISRVVVCLILGSLLIFISTKYSKKYGAKLAGEFDIMNMYP